MSRYTLLLLPPLINLCMGVIYAWGMFVLQLEELLPVSRAELSAVASVSLVSFTLGMFVHAYLLSRIGGTVTSALAFGLAGGGHLCFSVSPSFPVLLLGYGVAFGLGAGIGYGLALAIASKSPENERSIVIGVATAGFAAAGILLPFLLGPLVSSVSIAKIFGVIGVAMLVMGVLATVWLGVARVLFQRSRSPQTVGMGGRTAFLAVFFFVICFSGLAVVSQVSGILVSNSVSGYALKTGTAAFTAAYLAGSLLGGRCVDWLSDRGAMTGACAVSGLGLLLLMSSSPILALSGVVGVGLVFGSSASMMPMIVSRWFGPDLIGTVYGRLMLCYGLAGLLAPWLMGLCFDAAGDYALPLLLTGSVCLVLSPMIFLRRTLAKELGTT